MVCSRETTRARTKGHRHSRASPPTKASTSQLPHQEEKDSKGEEVIGVEIERYVKRGKKEKKKAKQEEQKLQLTHTCYHPTIINYTHQFTHTYTPLSLSFLLLLSIPGTTFASFLPHLPFFSLLQPLRRHASVLVACW
jgi:hypothetical protein